jgi:uncharacterized membrane protein
MSHPLHNLLPQSIADLKSKRKVIVNVNDQHEQSMSPLDRLAIFITGHVGTMGFFFIIFCWTVIWTGYNILATEVPALHWKPFDPFPAFVAYLLISNVIQILLMPLIMVGQNVQGRHSELRAESDFQINIKAEQEVELVLHHLEYQNAILITMLEKLGISPEHAIETLKARGITAPTSDAAIS